MAVSVIATADLFDVTSRVAIVTGASSGLGERFARVLHEAGAHVVITARRTERLAALAESLPGAVAVGCDLAEEDQLQRVVDVALDAFGRIDILVNNAGTSGPPVAAEDLSAERWSSTLAVNLSGMFGLTQRAGREMLNQGRGVVINVASVFGVVANAPVADASYAATKGGVINLTRELAAEWAPRGVRVNAIAPGWFPSEMTSSMSEDPRSQRYVERRCPMQRMGEPHELDGVLLFLSSDASSYCTGHTVVVDGGWTAW